MNISTFNKNKKNCFIKGYYLGHGDSSLLTSNVFQLNYNLISYLKIHKKIIIKPGYKGSL